MRRLRWSKGLFLVVLIFAAGLLGGSVPQMLAVGAKTVSLGGLDVINTSSAAAADFDGDGTKEIVIGGEGGYLFVIKYNGSSGSVVWSRQTRTDLNAAGAPSGGTCKSKSVISSSPAIADLDGDGSLEIVVSTGGVTAPDRNGGVLVYSYSSPWNFTPVPGWPQPKLDKVGGGGGASYPDGCWDGFYSSPAIDDIDGDGDLEVVIEGFDRHIHAWHDNGTIVDGWPIYRYTDETDTVEGTDCLLRGGWSSPALGDIDGDELPEVVVGTDSPPWPCPANWDQIDYQYATVWAINGDSTNVPGWPVTTENNIMSSPALGDIDGDGELEVVSSSGVSQEGGNGSWVYAWNGDGSPVSGWPIGTGGDIQAPPALGDIDDDGLPEVVVGCGIAGGSCTDLYAWNGNGSQVFGDDSVEILIAGLWSSYVAVVEPNGKAIDTTTFNDPGILASSPLVDDIDDDGYLEVVIGAGGFVYIWDVSGSASSSLPWPMFHRDAQRTGRFAPPKMEFVDEIYVFHEEGSGDTATTYESVGNLGDDAFEWEITHAIPGILQVIPPSGVVTDTVQVQLVITTTGVTTGTWQSWPITVTGTFGGNPVVGSPHTATLYLFVGDIERVYLPLVLRNHTP
jgi:hypothetical protein